MTDKRSPFHELEIQAFHYYKRQMTFKQWVDKYNIKLTVLARKIGVGRATMYKAYDGVHTLELATAVSIHVISGYDVSLFSLMNDDGLTHKMLREFLTLQNFNASGISGMNQLTRKHKEKIIKERLKNEKISEE